MSFGNIIIITTGLSDFRKMVITIFKTEFAVLFPEKNDLKRLWKLLLGEIEESY